MTLLETLAEYVTRLTLDDIPMGAVAKLKAAVAHNFACAFSGRILPWSKVVREFMDYANLGLVDLARKVDVLIDPECDRAYPEKKKAKVWLEFTDGSVVKEEEDDVKPLETEEVWENLRGEAYELLGENKGKEFAERLLQLEGLRDVSEIVEML